MQLLTLLVLATIAYAAHHDCSGNIVQALSKCSSAIQGGEPLASQQEQCAPDGCNYDRPSVDLINDLQNGLNSANTEIDNANVRIDSANLKIANLQTSQNLTEDTATNNTGTINSLKEQIYNVKEQISDVPTSCQDVKTRWPDSPSGTYLIHSPNGYRGYVYCYLSSLCGSNEGWMRIAYLDMTDPKQECPSVFNTVQTEDGLRCCGRVDNAAGCVGTSFSVKGTSYSEICGRVTGYQFGSPDDNHNEGDSHNDIESHYVDGVSITYGSPRQHVWTFIAAVFEIYQGCPCSGGNPIQDFIGNDYFCESGNHGSGWSQQLYTDDRLWDGYKCMSQEASCCDDESVPWFYKQLDSPATDDIELRVCGDQGIADEDNPIDAYEIFIK